MGNQSGAPKENEVYLSVVIPAYNEEKRIGKTLEAIDKYLKNQKYSYEIIVAEAGSTDKTDEVVENYAKMIPRLKLFKVRTGILKGDKVKAGMLEAKGKYRLFTDADNSTPIEEIAKFLPYFNEGYDVVIGSRAIDRSSVKVAQPLYRQLPGRIGNLLIQTLAVPGIKDTQCGFKCFSAKAAGEIFSRLTISGWGFDIEVLALANLLGHKTKEVSVVWINDLESKVSADAYITTLEELFRIKWNLINNRYK